REDRRSEAAEAKKWVPMVSEHRHRGLQGQEEEEGLGGCDLLERVNYPERDTARILSRCLKTRRVHGKVVSRVLIVVKPGVQRVKLGSLAQMIPAEKRVLV